MINYAADLYELASSRQQQLRDEARRERLTKQAARGTDEFERVERELSRGGSILKSKGKAGPAAVDSGRAPGCTPDPGCVHAEGSKHVH